MWIDRQVTTAVGRGLDARRDDPRTALVTWRYLRLALVVLDVGLIASIGYERLQAEGCWQTSISSYYYTPVQGVLVSTLVGIGVCLICLQGASGGEDALLNLAGLCALFVALVPTPDVGDCGSALTDAANRDGYVANGVVALLVMAWLALLLVGVLGSRRDAARRPTRAGLLGYAVALLAVAGATAAFVLGRAQFVDHAHDVAAVSMFLLVFLNVLLNAVQRHLVRRQAGARTRRFNRYAVIAVVMLADVGVHVALWQAGWPYWVLTAESSLIVLFAVFWSIQTADRWQNGVSPTPGRTTSPAPGAPLPAGRG